LYINLDTYNSFPPEVQTAVRLAAQSANETMLSRYEAENGPALQRLADSGTEVRTFSPEILTALQGYMASVHEENAAGNEFYARTLESFTAFRDSVRGWHRNAEYAFQNFVYSQEEQG
jgi:TRAP-type mannitol/chloroaromatic compound transport system substrate-binding protein